MTHASNRVVGYLSSITKRALTVIGRSLPSSLVRSCASITNYVQLGHWMHTHEFDFPILASDRWSVLDSVAAIVKDKRVLYLEFGVYLGNTMRYWSQQLANPQSQLHGFDSFQGLPEAGGFWGKGQFDTQGKAPSIADRRVKFFKGWFEDVLPFYTLPEHDILVVNCDADLYSSTIYVLRYLLPHMHAGTYVYFDDLASVEHQPRAIHEFLEESGVQLRAHCAHTSLCHAFFEYVPEPSDGEL